METSDSEYFESADEDFSSDTETQTKKTHNVKENTVVKVKEKIEDLSINDNLVYKSIEKKDSTNKDTINKGFKRDEVVSEKADAEIIKTDFSDSSAHIAQHKYNDNNEKFKDPQNTQCNDLLKVGACSLSRKNNESTNNDNQIQLDINNSKPNFEIPPAVSSSGFASEKTDDKLLDNLENKSENMKKAEERPKRPEFGIPPAIATCWEPGVTNVAQTFKPHPAYEKLMENRKRNDSEDESCNINVDKQTTRPEFGIPPARTTCWMPGLTRKDNNKNTQIDANNVVPNTNKPARPEFGIPPARTTCWIPGVTRRDNNKNTQNDANSDVTNINKPPRPEFGIPPARTTCWIPGVTKTDNVNTSFEIHPAYLELMQKKLQNRDIPSAVPNEPTHDLTNTDNTAQNTEKNMWDDEEDWGDFDIPAKQDEKPVEFKEGRIYPTQKESKEVEENMWEEDDDWEPVESNMPHQNTGKTKETSKANQEKSGWGDWSSWGLSSVISTATTLTTQVSQGITNVLETGIGAPDPAELARINKLEKEKIKEGVLVSNEELPSEKPKLGFGLGNLVQGVTKLVESTGTKVISGGLDTLETIGKKTMEVLQENDPGLKKKRAFLKLDDDKPILSHMLREAKQKAEEENKELEKKHFARKANYETLFDDHQGLVHLEALEMLSKQCDIKLQSLLESTSSDTLNDIQETLDQVKELCELPEEDDEETLSMDEIKERLESAVSEINVKITYSRLLATWKEVEDWLAKLNLKICNKNELHQQAIESLAQLTAIAVEQFHKAGELLLIKDHRSTADEADSLVQLTTTLTSLIGIVAARFSEKLNMAVVEGADKEEVNSLITNVFFEAANSSSYMQDAFQLLIPVLQVGAV